MKPNALLRLSRPIALITLVTLFFSASAFAANALHFDFASAPPAPGHIAVLPGMEYSKQRGYGYEPGAMPKGDDNGHAPYFFSVDLPEGNYLVSVTMGDARVAANTSIKAELRRLMLENISTKAGETITRSFAVNIRTPQITARGELKAGEVKLKVPRETTQEAWAWDRRLTLEVNGRHSAVRRIAIVPAKLPTLFLLGDSTVCDQSGEPYASWGQMLPRFFGPGIALANYGESGETYRDSIARRRLDKILSVMQPGDTVLMQFGHNDQKQIKEGKGGPFTTYKAEIRVHVEGVLAHGGIPVILSPMERRGFDTASKVIPSLAEYAEAARQAAQELNVAFIDLNAMSKTLYEALGTEQSKLAFAEPTPGKIDNTHHNNYGSYELAKAVVMGLRQAKLSVAALLAEDAGNFDPAQPDPVTSFAVPASPNFTNQRPLGDEGSP